MSASRQNRSITAFASAHAGAAFARRPAGIHAAGGKRDEFAAGLAFHAAARNHNDLLFHGFNVRRRSGKSKSSVAPGHRRELPCR